MPEFREIKMQYIERIIEDKKKFYIDLDDLILWAHEGSINIKEPLRRETMEDVKTWFLNYKLGIEQK